MFKLQKTSSFSKLKCFLNYDENNMINKQDLNLFCLFKNLTVIVKF